MKKLFFLFFLFQLLKLQAQNDFTRNWVDFFSYNTVKDFVIRDNTIFSISDNAVFTYQINTQELTKTSSVNGLSGESTSAVFYDENSERLLIGYETGLLEIIENDGSIRVSADIVNFNQSGEKRINHISANGNILYLSLPFGIVEYDISKLEFGDTFFIGNNSEAIQVNKTIIVNNVIYAATVDGIYSADLNNPNLIDFNNWTKVVNGDFSEIIAFNNLIYVASNNFLYQLVANSINQVRSFTSSIVSLDSASSNLLVTFNQAVEILNSNLVTSTFINPTIDFNFTANKSFLVGSSVFIATNEFGLLQSSISSTSQFLEIHPDGPLKNDIFSLKAKDNNLWIVYGGYSNVFAPLNTNIGYSHYNNEVWKNVKFDLNNPLPDLVDITFDPNNSNKVYISSFGDTRDVNTRKTGGLLVIEDDIETNFFNHLNSGLEDIVPTDPTRVTIRVSGSTFDNRGDLWMTNISVPNELKKFSNGNWSSFDISSVKLLNGFGLTEIIADRSNNIWIGSRRDGAIVFNENGNRLRALNTSATTGSLPNGNVRSIAADDNNRIWIGTLSGLVVFNNVNNVFNANIIDAEPVIILENGIPRRLLGDQTVNSIVVDGANNKWFGTDNGGVIYTSPNGQTTLATFNKENSPLPSNKIVKITVDKSTGKVFFATDKGMVAYNSNVSPFGNTLGEVYAYPNPATKQHQTVTIDGRNGTSLPRGTNLKILDVAGNLVFETNVIEGQQVNGGKVVWDKRNLAGKSVASGIYIVLLANEDASETSITKIAIIN